MSQSTFLAKIILLPRFVAYGLAVSLTYLACKDVSSFRELLLLLPLLGYPYLVHKVVVRSQHPESNARRSMLIDGLLVGFLILQSGFYLPAVVCFLSFLSMSTAAIAPTWMVLTNLSLALGVALIGWLLGVPFLVVAPLWIDGLFGAAMLFYLGFVAWRVFGVTRRLGEARIDEQAEKQSLQHVANNLKRYISPQLFASLSEQASTKATSRRQLTVCFTDLAGFTELTDRLPEESLTQLLNEYLNQMAEIAIRHGGTVDKFMGDGIMIFFGDPQTQGAKLDAIACVSMALEMQATLHRLCGEWREQGLRNQLSMRVGIHTGYCAVGNFGSESRMDYTAVGGTVNVASRLEGCAELGDIMISENTHCLVNESFSTESAGCHQLKGIRQAVPCFRVLGLYRNQQIADLDESIPGLTVTLASKRVDVSAARKTLQLVNRKLEEIEQANQSRQGVVRLLR